MVSFCFDDFPRSAYHTGGAILRSFGARGTYYAALAVMNTTNELGDQFTPGDLDLLLADGHELGSHTFSHISCRHVPLATFESDVQQGRTTLRQITGYDPENFAYPFGHVTCAAKKTIGAQMKSCRGIYGGINPPWADLNLLRANSLYGDNSQFSRIETLLAKACLSRGWLIFYTHDVSAHPSAFGCTPGLLTNTVAASVRYGFRIAPVGQVLLGAEKSWGSAPQNTQELLREPLCRRTNT
jgi:peptidoglycan/xylan/chitin deacetylase (PgdA/CDA1 family)